MAEATWEKSAAPTAKAAGGGRLKFLIGGLLILVAVAYLIISGTSAGARYFITVDELVGNPEYIGKTVRISGSVIGDTIRYDTQNLVMDFTIAHIPTEYENLALTLYEAANDPNATRLPVHIVDQPKPDLLQQEAQAILTGKLGADGVFYATELLLKCPTRFEEAEPGKAIAEPSA
ncbi:MAG: cytochrome c maturation protein CcmE [Chloroflexi bacterium]|nr:cytochrome c maturation protein CcmE [Chloroflexota bacterium]